MPAKAPRPTYLHHPCRVCRTDRNFKFVDKWDGRGRYLMVCTNCSVSIPRPGRYAKSIS